MLLKNKKDKQLHTVRVEEILKGSGPATYLGIYSYRTCKWYKYETLKQLRKEWKDANDN